MSKQAPKKPSAPKPKVNPQWPSKNPNKPSGPDRGNNPSKKSGN